MIKVAHSKFKSTRTSSNILDGYVGGRGCSTKHQKFSTSCENHIIGGIGEERSVKIAPTLTSIRCFFKEFATAVSAFATLQM